MLVNLVFTCFCDIKLVILCRPHFHYWLLPGPHFHDWLPPGPHFHDWLPPGPHFDDWLPAGPPPVPWLTACWLTNWRQTANAETAIDYSGRLTKCKYVNLCWLVGGVRFKYSEWSRVPGDIVWWQWLLWANTETSKTRQLLRSHCVRCTRTRDVCWVVWIMSQ